MTKEQYWQGFIAKNPAFATRETVTIKAEAMRKIIFQAHERGEEHGRESRVRSHMAFNEIFGGKGEIK